MRIGIKKLSFEIQIFPKYDWHTGIATLTIYKMYWNKDEKDWLCNWWTFIPVFGKRIKQNRK